MTPRKPNRGSLENSFATLMIGREFAYIHPMLDEGRLQRLDSLLVVPPGEDETRVFGPVSLSAPTFKDLDINLHRNSIGVEVVQSRVNDLVHPGDHDLLHKPRYLLGLTLLALHYQLVMDGEDQLGVEVPR
jgi:hypothetical protein